ncbi:MAG TPA: RDD family protein [Gemmataceae bacterium]|nr:RDD family protein [Gemmataceae bacterium]
MLHHVISTEKVPLVYRVAGIGSRFQAWLLDLLILLGLLVPIILIVVTWEAARAGLGFAVAMLLTFVMQWCYFLLFEWLWHGQTPGKRLVGIRVIDFQGSGISLGQAAVRNIVRVVDGLPLLAPELPPLLYGVGFLVAAFNPQQRRMGDLAASTLVVHVETKNTSLVALREGFAGQAPRTQLMRQRLEQLTRRQKETILDLCLRRDQLRVRERARLFAGVSDYFRQSLDLAPAEHQSDEKFVLQLAAALTADPLPLTPQAAR